MTNCMCVDCLFHDGNFERHGMGHTDQSGESVPRPSRWRGWSRIYQWGGASLLQICWGVVFMPSAPLQTQISLQYSSQSPSTDPWPLFPLEACKALDNLQVVQKKFWDSAIGESRDRRVLDAEFLMFQSLFAGLLLRSQKQFCDTKTHDNLSSIAGEYFDDMQILNLSSPTSYLDVGELQMLKSTISKYLRHWLQIAVTWKCRSRCS
jgi:hypothetical protein